jgi:hypothetical protein
MMRVPHRDVRSGEEILTAVRLQLDNGRVIIGKPRP